MDVRTYVARFMVHKVGAFVVKDRVLCFTAHGFSTYDPDTQQLTNSWSYSDVKSAAPLDGSETDFAIATPRHRIKKTVYRCPYRMEVLVCLMRLRSQHQARTPGRALLPELRSEVFSCIKFHRRGLQSPCVVEIGPDGVNQRDNEGELLSHIPYTSLVSMDLVCDDHNAIVLNHSDNSSLFVVDKRQRTEMAQAIHRVMHAYHIEINEYRKKTMEMAVNGAATTSDEPEISWQYPVTPVSATNKQLAPRTLAVSDTYIAEYGDRGAMISSRPLARIFSLVMFRDSNEAFEIVYVDGIRRTFYSPHRERLLTELLASCHAIQNTQVDVTTDRVPEALCMVPCKMIQSEGAKLLGGGGGGSGIGGETSKELHASDRELRIIQASLLQHLATYGSSKTLRTQRQLPQGVDEGFHTLALEFNANTPTMGVIAQPNKPFDKAIFYVAREIRDIVTRHGPRQPFLMTYLQTLYRLLHAPPAMKEFVGFILERGNGYLTTITELLVGRDPVVLYWILMVLQRLLESKSHRIQVREALLSNSAFLSTLLSLFDLDPKSQRYLSELPTMKLAQFVLLLVTTNPERQLELAKTLHEQLARRARMLHRILFGFPGLATVEGCVGILGRMMSTPSSVHVQGDTTEGSASASAVSSASALLAARAVEAPPLSMGFGEHLIFEPEQGRQNVSSTHMSRRALVARLGTVRSTRMVRSSRSSISNAIEAGGIAVQNPEVLLRQYRLFLEAASGPRTQAIDLYKEPMYLRLRYRCRNVFLQELMSHLAGSFDDFKRVFAVDCAQFSGFLGKTSGQREKSDLYLTPRALVAVRLVNRNTHEFEFRSIQRLCVPSEPRDAFCIIVKDKYLYVYSESRTQMLDTMRELAGVVGIRLTCEEMAQLPKPTGEARRRSSSAAALEGWDPRSIVNVVKRSGRHGFFRFRKKQIGVTNGMLLEADPDKHTQKSYSLKDLRRLVCVPSPHMDHHEVPVMIALNFADGSRIAYLSNDDASLLANLYDCCLYCQNAWVTLSPAFTRVNPRLTARSLVRHDAERAIVLNKEGMFVSMFRELSRDFEKLSIDGSAMNSASFEKVLFGLENLNYNVEEVDFRTGTGTTANGKIAQLSFRTMFQGLAAMLQYATKPPMRCNEIAVVLEAFCRVNDGCYRLASDETPERISAFVKRLLAVIEAGDQLTTLWAIRALHSLSADSRSAPSYKQAEKNTRALVLGHDKLVAILVGILDRDHQPLCALATLDLLYDVVIKGRSSTDNNHFDAIIKRLSMHALRLQTMAAQTAVVGVAVFATGLLRVTLDHTDVHAHQRMCDAALQSGRTPRNLYHAFFFPTEAGRFTFRYIAAMWIVHHKPSFELLQRLLPRGFLRMISTPAVKKTLLQLHENGHKRGNGTDGTKPRKKHRDEVRGGVGGSEWFIRRMRQEIATNLPESDSKAKVREDGARSNYPGECHGDVALLAELLQQDFFLPDVIWNGRMREELKAALERTLSLVGGTSNGVVKPQPSLCWNHWQFTVEYPSLVDEIEIDHVYLRVLVARVRDGSLHLDEARKAASAATTALAIGGPHRGHAGEAGQILHSVVDIVTAPRAFYDGVYQRWLEMRLRGPSMDGSHAMEYSQLRLSELCAQPAAEAGEELLMKTLIEMAKSFSIIRAMPSSRVDFLLELVCQSFEAREVANLIQLLAHCSADRTTARHLTKPLHLSTIVFLAVLAHRRPTTRHNCLATIGDGDEFPVIECDFETSVYASASSIPMTQLSGNSRLSLRWKCKRNGDKDETAYGPVSALELHQYLKRTHSAALHQVMVCCCTIHDKHDSSEHEWRVLHQVPELRWMELVAEPLDAAAVGVQALTIVRNVVRNEPDGAMGESSEYLIPLPMGKKLLSTKAILAQLVQLLLVDDLAVRTLACEILRSLGLASGPKLFEYGLFFFVFATDSDSKVADPGCFVAEGSLLQQYHRVQDCRETRAGQSFLVDMLPEPLIALLDSEPAEYFADVFTGRTTDKRVLWTPSMRDHLRLTVRDHIEEFLEDLKRDVAVTYRYVSLPPIKYHELSRDVYCSGYFLSTIAEGDDACLDAIEEPQILMNAIEEKWRALRERHTSTHFHSVEEESATAFKTFGWQRDQQFTMTELRVRYCDLCKKGAAVATVRTAYESLSSLLERKQERANGRTSDDVIECILLAQLRLLEKFSFQFFSYESRALPLLLDSISSDAKFGDLCVQILHLLLSSAPLNILSLLEMDDSWDRLLDMIDLYAVSSHYAAKSAAFSILQIVASSEHGPRSLLRSGGGANPTPAPLRLLSDVSDTTTTDDESTLFAGGPTFHSQSQRMETAQSKRFCTTLEKLLTAFEARQPWQIQKLLYDVVTSLCASRHFQEQLVLSTKLFWRALYLLLSTAENVAQGPDSIESSDDGEIVALKERDVVEAAFHALRALSMGLDGQSRSQGLDALANLLPLEFLDCLDRPSGHDFWMISSTDIRAPTCIWNGSTRSELLQMITDHCNGHDGGDDDELLFLETATSYMYDCLKSEPLVGGIYLRILIAKGESDQESITADCLYPSTPHDFVQALFVFLNENRDPTVGIYADTLPALQCLNVLVDLPVFKEAIVDVLEQCAEGEDSESESVSVATLGRYLLPFDRSDKGGMSISSRRSLSSYGFLTSTNGRRQAELDGLPPGMEAEFGNVDYLNRQEFALLILNKLCGLEFDLEKMFAPFCRYTWSLQVIADHLDYEQAFYALSCLAELCDTCLVVAEYVEMSGLWVEILGIAIQSRQHVLHEHFLRAEALREPAFEVLYALLTKDFAVRESMYSGLGRFLPYPVVYQIHLDPSMAGKFFDDNHEKSDLIWNSYWRTEVRRTLDEVICRNRIERSKAKRDSVILADDDYVHMPENFVAGLYLDNFLARPDPEDLTNPAYNLELLFQEWKEKLQCLMGFDLENPPQFLKDLAVEVEQLTTAMTHIMRAPLGIEESIEAFDMPGDVLKLVRHCNKLVVAGFPYRCTLRIARQLANFEGMQSQDFLELLFCRVTVDHPDIPLLVKLLRRVLEARAQSSDPSFTLKDLAYFSSMVKYLDCVVTEKKDNTDAKVLSNINRILRIIKTEQRNETMHNDTHMSQSFFQRMSARWHNATLLGIDSQVTDPLGGGTRPSRLGEVDIDAMMMSHQSMMSHHSFDVDAEHAPDRPSIYGTFNVDDERERNAGQDAEVPPAPRSKYLFDGETIHAMATPPHSFRFVNGVDESEEPSQPVARASLIRATYEPVDRHYHSTKAAQYDREDETIGDHSHRASLTQLADCNSETKESEPRHSEMEPVAPLAERDDTRLTEASQTSGMLFSLSGMPSTRRNSLLDSWRGPASNKPNSLLSSMTISRHGRRATAVFSRRKTHQSGRWFK